MIRRTCRALAPLGAVLLLLPLASTASAAPIVFENDLAGWNAASGGAEVTIDFEEISGPVQGDEYSAMPGGPVFTLVEGVQLEHAPTTQATASSGVNFFSPDQVDSEGIIRLTFDEPIRALGAYFFDVETDFALTGFATTPGAAAPDVAFSGPQGQSAQSFLGFVADDPLTAVDIFFATGPHEDGTVLDDLRYARADGFVPVPEPLAGVLLGVGVAGTALGSWRRRRSS